ncbi:ATP-binding protein [Marinospirillum celere]|nr:ATP-binding protein [Marinospirillum celere]
MLLNSYQSSVSNFRDSAFQQSEEHTSALLELQKTLVQAKLHEMQRALQAITHLIENPGLDNQQLLQALYARKHPSPEILAIILLNNEGETEAFSRPGENPSLGDREYFTWHLNNPESGQFYLSPPLQARHPEQFPFVALSKAITDDEGQLSYVLAMAIDLKMLAEDLSGLVSANGHTTVLAHQSGEIYFRMPWFEDAVTQQSPVIADHQGELAQSHLTRIASPFDGHTRQIAYGRVGTTPLVVFISENLEPTLAAIDDYQQKQALRWGLAFLIATLLFAGLAGLIRSRHKNLQQLLESEERYRLAKEAANIGVWDLNPLTGELTWDQQLWQQLGYSQPEFKLTKQSWLDSIHPEDLDRVIEITSRKIQECQPFEIEYRSRTSQGSWLWLLGKGQVIAWNERGHSTRVLGTSQIIEDRKQTEQQLQEQAEALKASNEELEQFAYVASHDLRQPLRMIRSYVELLNKRLAGQLNEETNQFMTFINEGAQRMDNMLVSLLEYSRVGRKGEPISEQNLRQLAAEALSYLQPQIKESQAKIEFQGQWPEQLPTSRNEIVRLFQNLLNNALKYQPPGQQPQVLLTASKQGQHWQVSIQDNGIGIAKDQQDRLFKVFQRLHTRQEYEGTGIGLAICRKIVERHGGEIWLESEGKGQGTCMHFTLATNLD